MAKYPDYISPKREPIKTPDAIVENGQAHFGTFLTPFQSLNLTDCDKPCGEWMPDCMKKGRVTEWEAFELHLDEGMLVSAIYNTGAIGFSIFVWFDKRDGKIYSWKNFVPVKKAKVAPQLIDGECYLKTKNSEYAIINDLGNGKAKAIGYSVGKAGKIALEMNVERISPPSRAPPFINEPASTCVCIPLANGTPSSTMSGWLLPSIEDCPRNRILEAPPPAPDELGVMVRPADLPCRALTKLTSRARVSSVFFTVCVA